MSDEETLHWGKPFDARRYHIFDGKRSLCGSWMFGAPDDPVTDDDEYRAGEDCKSCCRSAGLEVNDE
ncbi:hypothetical protein [Halorussus amylolyticus]|uniref:hypothetical protein n=1 Tax=Halorussus amylolyticus TaxID=1126242 RepID=UPI0010462C43|nr:hypothetical protein [Halorussus amylolyticus]